MPRMKINVGPIHPSTHGVLRLIVDVEGDTIMDVEPHIGFLHRGVEKLMETRMYMQNPSYTEKLDYVAPMGWDDLYVSAVESAIGVEVSEPAQYARMILLELQRIASHLLWLGTLANDLGQMFTVFMWAFRERAKVLKLLEDVTGSRMFYVNFRLGGLSSELPIDFEDRTLALMDYLEEHVREYTYHLDSNPIFMERTKNIGVLTKKNAIDYGVTGPIARASGIDFDARKELSYYMYKKIKFNTPVLSNGDCYDRYKIRFIEIQESINIIRACVQKMPKGSVKGAPIKLIGQPAKIDNIIIQHRELPRGEGIIYLVPEAQRPYRIALRSPSYINLSVLPYLSKGAKYADLFAILGSLDVVMAEIDK